MLDISIGAGIQPVKITINPKLAIVQADGDIKSSAKAELTSFVTAITTATTVAILRVIIIIFETLFKRLYLPAIKINIQAKIIIKLRILIVSFIGIKYPNRLAANIETAAVFTTAAITAKIVKSHNQLFPKEAYPSIKLFFVAIVYCTFAKKNGYLKKFIKSINIAKLQPNSAPA